MAVLAPGTKVEQGNPRFIGSITQVTGNGLDRLRVFLRDNPVFPTQRDFVIEYISEDRDSDYWELGRFIMVVYRYLPQSCSAQFDDSADYGELTKGFPNSITAESIRNYENLFIEGMDFTIPTALETLGVETGKFFCEIEI